jgi:predicted N-acetyltransferase YhbS
VTHFERSHGDYLISTDPMRLDLDVMHRWLSQESYWAQGRTRETVERSVAASLNFGAYDQAGEMVGAVRVVTDGATFGWLCDLFVLENHRGKGIGIALVEACVEHPDLADLKRYVLATADAHDLYSRFGFEPMANADWWMMRRGPTA